MPRSPAGGAGKSPEESSKDVYQHQSAFARKPSPPDDNDEPGVSQSQPAVYVYDGRGGRYRVERRRARPRTEETTDPRAEDPRKGRCTAPRTLDHDIDDFCEDMKRTARIAEDMVDGINARPGPRAFDEAINSMSRVGAAFSTTGIPTADRCPCDFCVDERIARRNAEAKEKARDGKNIFGEAHATEHPYTSARTGTSQEESRADHASPDSQEKKRQHHYHRDNKPRRSRNHHSQAPRRGHPPESSDQGQRGRSPPSTSRQDDRYSRTEQPPKSSPQKHRRKTPSPKSPHHDRNARTGHQPKPSYPKHREPSSHPKRPRSPKHARFTSAGPEFIPPPPPPPPAPKPKPQPQDYYSILGCHKDSTEADIKKAYRKMSMLHHPDKCPGDAEAKERFQKIGEAYETLGDPVKKAKYDCSRAVRGME